MRLVPRRCLIPELLVRLEWTQRQLSERCGISEQTLSKYITMTVRDMPLAVAIPIADALDVSERELYEWARE